MTQPHRVLIVDDNAAIRDALRTFLAIWPEVMWVGEATNGWEAVHLVAECQPDVVLMDVRMPIMDGILATKMLKQLWPEITVILHTMDANAQIAARVAGADGFVIKGSQPERLLHALGVRTVGCKQ